LCGRPSSLDDCTVPRTRWRKQCLWEERERKRAELMVTLDEAEASLARGEGRVITEESMRELAEEVKQRGRSRLAAEQSRR
jgi:hypothetical protein